MCICHCSGAFSLFLLVIRCVVAVEIHGCRSNIASAPTLATLGAVTNVTQTQSAVMARKGDAMDEDVFTKGSYKHVSKRYRQEQELRGRVLVLREEKSLSFRRSQETGTTTGCGRGVRRSARSNKK